MNEDITNGVKGLSIRLRRNGCGATRGPESNKVNGREKSQKRESPFAPFALSSGCPVSVNSAKRLDLNRVQSQSNRCRGSSCRRSIYKHLATSHLQYGSSRTWSRSVKVDQTTFRVPHYPFSGTENLIPA
jgi:hypothetical protein